MNDDYFYQIAKPEYPQLKLEKISPVSPVCICGLTTCLEDCAFKGVLHLCALFLKTLCIFSKNKATLDKVSYGSGQKCSKELENYSFTSVETIVVKLQ